MFHLQSAILPCTAFFLRSFAPTPVQPGCFSYNGFLELSYSGPLKGRSPSVDISGNAIRKRTAVKLTPFNPLTGIVAAMLIGGCASHPLPAAELAASEASIAHAVAAGAAELAPRELRLAREKLALTRLLLAARDHEPARWLAEQAAVDAELAAVKASAAKATRGWR
jgi:hypothetical protein